ncbi:hypothetical protein [uncultured Sulfitobacter sp.]|uniref:hypothetical protein n=1 Tax=uncultured Sulfitobacter sp. TaxID=191468 RepID=UPI002601D966|nr:hypothetical protein [uncultured Sulfitobacter sp.]
MLNPDMLLAVIQWALIGVGLSLCFAAILAPFIPSSVTPYVYTYQDGQTVEAVPSGDVDAFAQILAVLATFAFGLLAMALGAILFCLRRIGIYMGDLRSELRQSNSEEI